MSRALATGSWIHFDHNDHQVVRLDGTCVHLRSVDGDEQHVLTSYLLSHDSFTLLPGAPGRSAALAGNAGESDGQAEDADADTAAGDDADTAAIIATLPEQKQAEVFALEQAIVAIVAQTDEAPGEVKTTALVKAKAAELGMSESTLWRGISAWRAQGIWGLVDHRQTRLKDPIRGADPRIISAIVDQASAETRSSTARRNRFRELVTFRLQALYGDEAPTLPSPTTFTRWCDHLLGGRHTFGKSTTRRSAANSPQRPYLSVRATRAGEVVMIDATPIDVICYDPATDTNLSVELAIGIDLATRTIAAWRFTPKGSGGVDIALLLADMLAPTPMRRGWRDSVRFKHQGVMFERLAHIDERLEAIAALPLIYPETLVVDNGSIMISKAVVSACKRLGINLQMARLHQPTDKPQVERAFSTIGSMFSEHVAGYKGANVISRGEDVDAEARFTIDELEEFFAEWVVTVYQRRTHRGLTLAAMPELRMSPNDAYAHAIALTGWIPVPGPEIYYELLPMEKRFIDRKGVTIGGLTYNGPIVGKYANRRSGYPNMGGRWPFRVDPRNRLQVYFKDPDTGIWETLRWVEARLNTEPFSERTYDYVRQQLVERGTSNPHEQDVADALADLHARTGAPERWTKTDRRAIAKDRARTRAAAQDLARAQADELTDTHVPDELPAKRTQLRVVTEEEDFLDLDDITAFDTFDTSNG